MTIELIEIKVAHWQPGDTEYFDILDNTQVTVPEDWQTITQELSEEKPGITTPPPMVVFNAECWGWDFTIIGNSFDYDYCGGIQYELNQMDTRYIFESYLEQLKEFREQVLKAYESRGGTLSNTKKPSITWHDFEVAGVSPALCRFVTVWEYEAHHDYYGEYDNSWQLLGWLDLNKKNFSGDVITILGGETS